MRSPIQARAALLKQASIEPRLRVPSLLELTLLSASLLALVACEGERPPAESPDASAPSAGEQSAGEQSACLPDCEGRSCGVDPRCGLSCGDCADDERCEAAQCVAEPPPAGATAGASSGPQAGAPTGGASCAESCEALGAECGEACGVSCGVCAEGSVCEGTRCVCTPQCAGRACGEPDGCGGTCSPCPRALSCEGCALSLRVVSLEERAGVVSGARVALSVQLPEGAPHPEIAELQLELTGPAVIGRVGLGEVVANARKQLVPNPATGLPYRADGARYSFLLMSTQNSDEIPSGEWLIIDLMLGDTSARPVQVAVVQREQTFAPPAADLQLWGASLGEPLVIWPALSQGE